MSREDPTLVVSPRQTERFLGGAAIVAAHAAVLGANTRFFSVTGNDPISSYVSDQLSEHGVEAFLVNDDSRPTTLKRRYRCEGKTLLRVSDLRQHEISGSIQDRLLTELETAISGADVLIFSDFNYGCLPQNFVAICANLGRQKQCIIAADSQSSSQLGDISRYHGTHLVTPTEHELRVALRDQVSGLSTLGKILLERSHGQGALVTLGASGVLVVTRENSADEADRVPALNRSPVDVSGAGDSLLVAATLTLAAGGNIYDAALLGSFAAAIQTSRLGNTPIQVTELQRVIH
jgi:rfaE bifunctional protein kinase chain/domain